MTPREGNEARVGNLLEALDTAFAQESGYVLGLRFKGMDEEREVGRIFVWETQDAARKAEASPEAAPILRRIRDLIEQEPLKSSYELEGYALKPT